ncbi:MAG: chemotaxis response regulator protein-glutamate methylesterase [Planctomycetota bacterium]|nr:MAG: chemotaxis response regulator protein-glutamate methylesterase [Planctomycetota bacterium]
MTIKVLIVDDSALVRKIFEDNLSKVSGIEVVGTAQDPFVARDKIIKLKPDVLTLDVEMPRMDGIEFLKRLMMSQPIPVIIVSSLTHKAGQITLDALSAGAIDYITKPGSNLNSNLNSIMTELVQKIKIAATVDISKYVKREHKKTVANQAASLKTKSLLINTTDKVIAMGASTGGTEAIATILEQLPPNLPGIVITQHMPPKFTKDFAARLNRDSALEIKEGQSGMRIMDGCAFIAPGGFHMRVKRSGGNYIIDVKEGDLVNGHAPSVDVLFDSVAQHVGKNALGVILTGMGKDGAKGLLNMRNAGAHTIGQNEATSVVYGMPKVAYELKAVAKQMNLDDIAGSIQISFKQLK